MRVSDEATESRGAQRQGLSLESRPPQLLGDPCRLAQTVFGGCSAVGRNQAASRCNARLRNLERSAVTLPSSGGAIESFDGLVRVAAERCDRTPGGLQ